MDKTRKLRRYNRKDYTAMVEFPVEIVGRDGVVRRYSFEDSIRLYQHRISSAAGRYDDGEIARAEAQHCRRRIDQLRRSYLERYGEAVLQRSRGLALAPGLASELTAFVRRCVCPQGGMDLVELAHLGQLDHCEAYSLRPEAGASCLVLYLYSFDSEDDGSGPCRTAFFAQVKLLQRGRSCAPDVETLVAFHHTADFGLVLAGAADAAAALARPFEAPEMDALLEGPEQGRPQLDALSRLRRGDAQGALRVFEQAYERHPYRRSAYLGAAVVADQLGHFEAGALAAQMGSHYFPGDSGLAWHLAVAQLRLGDLDAAECALDRARALRADEHAVCVLQGLIALRRSRLGQGRRELARAAAGDSGRDPALAHTRKRLRLSLAALGAVRLLALGGCGLALFTTQGSGGPWVMAALAFALLFLVARPVWQRWLKALVSRSGATGLSLASVATLQGPAGSPQASESSGT